MSEQVTIDDFEKIKIAVGQIVEASEFQEARKPAYKLLINFGEEIGVKRSSVQITDLYSPDELVGRQVLAVVNFPPRQVGPFESEVLTLGVPAKGDLDGPIALVSPDREVPLGVLLY